MHKTRSILLYALFVSSAFCAAIVSAAEQGSLSDINALSPTKQAFPQDFVHGLVNLEFSNYHLTPRGINLQDKGLIFQPLVRLDWNLYKPTAATNAFINDAYVTTAVWNDIDTVSSGVQPGHWNEIDFTVGPNVRFLNDWTLESPFTAFKSQTESFATCWAWDPRLTYHDHFIQNFSLNPYVEFFDELKNKITVVLVPAESHTSFYFALGMDPTYVFQKVPLKLELPTYILIPGNNFYQQADGSGGGTDLGLFATMFKVTVPLNFITYGKWGVYAGVQYDYLNNPGLLDGNQIVGAAHSPERNLVVFHGGVTLHF
jgi:hypothetical protein